MRAAGLRYTIRPYADADEAAVLELLTAALGPGPGGRRSPEFFRWKHLENPFGRSLMLVADEGDRIIGLRALMRWRFVAGDRVISAARPVDTATHPDAQGRGVFSRLTKEGLSALGGSASVLFNTPNEKSLPGYLKMGWKAVGSMPISVRIRRPLRFASRVRSRHRAEPVPGAARPRVLAEPAAHTLADDGAIEDLLRGVAAPSEALSTPKGMGYLRWRYGAAPLLDYRAVRRDEGERTVGLGIFRVRARGELWETTIAELLVRDGDVGVARRLLRDVVRASFTDLQTFHAPSGFPGRRAVTRAGFLPSPIGMTFVAHPLLDGLSPDPTRLRSWALSLGDLEVF